MLQTSLSTWCSFLPDSLTHSDMGDNAHVAVAVGGVDAIGLGGPYKCIFCDRSFREMGGLSKHMKRMHKKKKYVICSKKSCGLAYLPGEKEAHVHLGD